MKREAEREGLADVFKAAGARLARVGLLDVHRDERRPAVARPVRGQHVEPQLRGPPGQGRPDVPRLAADRRRVRDQRASSPTRGRCPASRRSPRSGDADAWPSRSGIFTSKVIPIDAENVDTDQIVPARYLKVTDKVGLADALFRDWRFEEDGSLKDPPFILDQPGMAGRGILLVGDNFGAGSSREHAPWALTSWGVRAILSTGFADIFRSNSLKNGLLPIAVPPEVHRRLRDLIERDPDAELTVDLAEQGVLLPDGSTIDFEIDPFAKRMLLAGTDELGYLLSKETDIVAWESTHPPRIETRVTT